MVALRFTRFPHTWHFRLLGLDTSQIRDKNAKPMNPKSKTMILVNSVPIGSQSFMWAQGFESIPASAIQRMKTVHAINTQVILRQ